MKTKKKNVVTKELETGIVVHQVQKNGITTIEIPEPPVAMFTFRSDEVKKHHRANFCLN